MAVRAALVLVAMTTASAARDGEALSTCDAIRTSQGVAAFVRCVARQHGKNFLPGYGSAPGMTMDEIDKKAEELTDFCHTEGGTCDGVAPGTKLKNCEC